VRLRFSAEERREFMVFGEFSSIEIRNGINNYGLCKLEWWLTHCLSPNSVGSETLEISSEAVETVRLDLKFRDGSERIYIQTAIAVDAQHIEFDDIILKNVTAKTVGSILYKA
jgi:hypothetical protein